MNYLNYYEEVDFSREVYTLDLEFGEVLPRVLKSLCEETAVHTTTPKGVAPSYHVRGHELWTWGYGGNCPHMIESFASKKEAEHALLMTFLYDLKGQGCLFFYTREEAQKAMEEWKEGDKE